ncbi:MAG: CinA family protein [Chloroflexota bacterium]|nr:CinA family protein [Chloroflexota bacterium]
MDLEELASRLQVGRMTLAVAESAAGGLLCAELSRLPGSSAFFRGGVVAYDDGSKTELLHVPSAVLIESGSVSQHACLEMASSVRDLFGADIGLAETSISGPAGGTRAKPVGLCFVAVSGEAGDEVRRLRFTGDREHNRRAAVQGAIDLLAAYLGIAAK